MQSNVLCVARARKQSNFPTSYKISKPQTSVKKFGPPSKLNYGKIGPDSGHVGCVSVALIEFECGVMLELLASD
jgi:hypothetical protein